MVTPIPIMTKYIKVPMPQFEFKNLDLTARCVFGLIYDRWLLSRKTQETSDRFAQVREVRVCDVYPKRFPHDRSIIRLGFTYCVYAQSEIAEHLGISERTVRRCIDDLVREKVVEVDRAGVCGANRYFIPSDIDRYLNPPPTAKAIDRQ